MTQRVSAPPMRALFDPATEQPPTTAVELYLEAPLSVGLFHHLASQNPDLAHHVPAIEAAREAGVAAVLECLQSEVAQVKVGAHHPGPGGATIGRRDPATLHVTRVRHVGVAGWEDTARLHDHLYVGQSATSREDGRLYPVCLDSFNFTVRVMMDALYRDALERTLVAAAGVEWSMSDSARDELVAPPLAQRVPDYPRVWCHWHPRLAHRWVIGDRNHNPHDQT